MNVTEALIRDKWDTRFLELAAHIATWSKDSSTQVGACIADPKHRIVSLGFNGSPRGIADAPPGDRDEKLRRTIHAELNALGFAQRSVEGCTLYVTHPPCAHCAAQIIQAGIARVVYNPPTDDFLSRWIATYTAALQMFVEAGVEVTP